MQREQAIVREIASMISIVACCHGAKICAHAARDFRSQQHQQRIFRAVKVFTERLTFCAEHISKYYDKELDTDYIYSSSQKSLP